MKRKALYTFNELLFYYKAIESLQKM